MEEQEINLRDYINVVIRRKRAVLAIFFVSVITVAIITFLMPKVYEVSMVIEPAIFGVTDKGEILYLDSAVNVREKIEKGAFNEKITRALNLDPRKGMFNFKVYQPVESEFLKISIEQRENQISSGIKILKQLFTQLHNTYEQMVASEKRKIEEQISVISNDIEMKKDEISRQKEMEQEGLKLLETKEDLLSDAVKVSHSFIKKLLDKKDAVLEKSEQTGDIAPLLHYTNSLRQNLDYFEQLHNKLDGLRAKKASIIAKSENLKKAVDNLKIKIEGLNREKDNIRNIRLIQNPEASPYPIRPKKRLSIAIAGVVSLVFGVFLAFFQEFWDKSKV